MVATPTDHAGQCLRQRIHQVGATIKEMTGSAVRILVVCTGNLCRSPLAAELLRIRLVSVGAIADVRSAGTEVAPNDRPPKAMVDAGLRVGADISWHRAVPITDALVRGADLVLTSTIGHCREVLTHCEEVGDRIFTLVEAADIAAEVDAADAGVELDFDQWREEMNARRSPAAYWRTRYREDDIEDPYGGPPRRYDEVAKETAAVVDRFVKSWVGRAAAGPIAQGLGTHMTKNWH